MKILLDTNILIAASRYPNGTPFKALLAASEPSNHLCISEQNLEEMYNVYNRIFPDELHLLKSFFDNIIPFVEVISIPDENITDENKIRHVKDRPILRAAIAANVDIIITGDNDFLESDLTKPKIMTPAEFVALSGSKIDE